MAAKLTSPRTNQHHFSGFWQTLVGLPKDHLSVYRKTDSPNLPRYRGIGVPRSIELKYFGKNVNLSAYITLFKIRIAFEAVEESRWSKRNMFKYKTATTQHRKWGLEWRKLWVESRGIHFWGEWTEKYGPSFYRGEVPKKLIASKSRDHVSWFEWSLPQSGVVWRELKFNGLLPHHGIVRWGGLWSVFEGEPWGEGSRGSVERSRNKEEGGSQGLCRKSSGEEMLRHRRLGWRSDRDECHKNPIEWAYASQFKEPACSTNNREPCLDYQL